VNAQLAFQLVEFAWSFSLIACDNASPSPLSS
jgi:hypothetical protein